MLKTNTRIPSSVVRLPAARWSVACLPVCLALLTTLPAHAEAVKRTRYPALSPDGKTLAFAYQGDLWSVSSKGGRAQRLTSHVAREMQPLFTPDGGSLVFASNRYGNYDLFVMPAEGGPARQLTFHSRSEYPSGFTPDGKWLLYYGGAYGNSDLYKVPLAGGEPLRLSWDRQEWEYHPSISPDGQWIAYNHNASPGSWRRRDYAGSNNADIWIARFTTPLSEPRKLITNPSHDFYPMFSRDGKKLYYISDRSGQVNLWSRDLDSQKERQLTQHTTDGVRVPSYAPKANLIAYEYDSEIWLLNLRSNKTERVPIEISADERRNLSTERTYTTNPSEYTVSPDGKKVALVVRGDLFVVPATGGTARKLVGRPSRESHIAWMPDSKTILFSTDVNGQKDLHRIDISGENEKALTTSPDDESGGLPSPDGKLIAFHRGDRKIVVIPAEGGQPVAEIEGRFLDVTRNYTSRFNWSPDSKWLVFVQRGTQNMEGAAYVVSVSDPKPRRVSRYFRDMDPPRWSADGKLIYFPAVAVDEQNLYAIDMREEPKPEFEEDALDRLDQPSKPSTPTSGAADKQELQIDFDTITDRLRRITNTGNVRDAVLTPNSRFFLIDVPTGVRMVPIDATNSAGVSLVDNASGIEVTRDSSRVYFISGGQIQSIGLSMRDRRTTEFRATVTLNLVEENRQVFSEAWWLMDRYFYHPQHNGVDWRAIRAKYEALLPYAPYKDDFYDLMNEMIQELRGSHLGVSGASDYQADPAANTAYLGIEPDWAVLEREGRIRIASVTPKSPAASKWSKLHVGEYILEVDGHPIPGPLPFDALLNRKAGKKVVLRVNSKPELDGSREVAIKPISDGDDLEYDAWVEANRKRVHELSGGKVAYLHVRAMNSESEMRFKEEFVSEATGRDALIVDVRYNPGGNVSHRLLDILRKKPYVFYRPRTLGTDIYADRPYEYMWAKPAALLINQASASNSEMMAEGFRALGIGPIVGVPTMGAVISTGSWNFLDGGSIRMPTSGVFTADGKDLEVEGRKPDYEVPYDPVAILQGRDPQLERAVKLMLEQIAKQATAK